MLKIVGCYYIIIQLNMENEDNVLYCKLCLSLRVMDADGEEYCGECGCASIDESSLEQWEELYILRYKREFLERKKIKKNIYKFY